METGARFYKPSGKVPVMGIVHSLIWGILVGAVLSFLYVPACIHIPFIFLNAIIWLFFAGISGIGVMASVKQCKVRNPFVASLLGAFSGISTVYIHWAVYCSFTYGFHWNDFFRFLSHPGELFDHISRIAEHGTWSIGRFGSGVDVSGIALWIVWIIEALGIIAFPVFVSHNLSSELFSESQNKWLDKDAVKSERELFSGSPDDLKTQLLRGDFSSLLTLKPNPSSSSAHTRVELTSSGDPNEIYLSVYEVKPNLKSKRSGKMQDDRIIENMIISDANYKMIKDGLQM